MWISAWREALRRAHHTTWHPCPRGWKAPIQSPCCCRAEQIPACLQSLPVGTLALPSITQGQTGHRSLPDLTGCPGFPHFSPPLNLDLAQPCLCEAYRSSELSFCFFFFLSLQEKKPKPQNNEELGWLHLQNNLPSAVDREKICTLLEPCYPQLPT